MRPIFIFSFLLSAGLFSCEKTVFETEGDHFFLSHNQAKMPVWVKGNFNSDVILITVHGGPGDSGYEFPLSTGFQYLEEDYLMVYWDQRFSGMAQGNPELAGLTLDQFAEDTDRLVKLIQHKYPGKQLFMLGHSFGGQVSAAYLGRDNNENQFRGWIDLDGSVYAALEAQIMREWILAQIPERMNRPGADVEFWQYIIDWYDQHPVVLNYTDNIPYTYAGALDGYAYDWEKTQANNPTPYRDLIFSSMFGMSFYLNPFYFEGNFTWADSINLTPEIESMQLPTLLLWGEHDGSVPVAVADYVYEHLGTHENDKHLVIIPECAHSPHYDQPELFAAHVSQFIESYK